MPRMHKTLGYDELPEYSEAELIQMYVKEGKSIDEAKRLARVIHLEMDRMRKAEERLWRKIKTHEVTEADLDKRIDDE